MNMSFLLMCYMCTIILLLTSCADIKYVSRGNKYYKVSQTGTNHDLTIHTVKRKFPATIVEKENYLIIRPVGSVLTSQSSSIRLKTAVSAHKVSSYYFPEVELDPNGSTADRFVYFDSKPVFQALTIPLKIRPQIRDFQLKDSFPSQVETGFNFAFAIGYKFVRNIYKADKNFLGQFTNRSSITPGFLVGAAATDLKKSNTRQPIIEFERKAPLISLGGFVMMGFNNINFGYVLGVDYAFGTGAHSWLYRGRAWHGIAIGLDIIK